MPPGVSRQRLDQRTDVSEHTALTNNGNGSIIRTRRRSVGNRSIPYNQNRSPTSPVTLKWGNSSMDSTPRLRRGNSRNAGTRQCSGTICSWNNSKIGEIMATVQSACEQPGKLLNMSETRENISQHGANLLSMNCDSSFQVAHLSDQACNQGASISTKESPCMSFDESQFEDIRAEITAYSNSGKSNDVCVNDMYANMYVENSNYTNQTEPNSVEKIAMHEETVPEGSYAAASTMSQSKDVTDWAYRTPEKSPQNFQRPSYNIGNAIPKEFLKLAPHRLSNSYPPYNLRSQPNINSYLMKSLSADNDLDTDSISVMCTRTSNQMSPPSDVPSARVEVYKKFTKPPAFDLFFLKKDSESPVYIQHREATDDPRLGDKFGVSVRTDDSKKKDGYYRHFFKKLIIGSPADQMQVRNDDEIVMVNDVFAPDRNHEQILLVFSHVPVDGVTRFKMVLRRRGQNDRHQWEWFETSAILVPELNEEPKPKDPKVKPLGDMYDHYSWQMYKVRGTQYYITLTIHGVSVDILYNDEEKDRCKLICKHTRVCEDEHDPSKMSYLASLSCANKMYYMTILHSTRVITMKQEIFFQYRKMGSEIYFKQNDKYLSCNDKQVVPSQEEYFFEEFPMNGHKDVPDCVDGSFNDAQEHGVRNELNKCRRITRSMSRQASFTTQMAQITL